MDDKYISAEAFKLKTQVEMTEEKAMKPTDVDFHKFLDAVYSLIARGVDEMPAADVVEAVRCKDCKYNGGDCERCLNPNLPIVGDDATYLAIDPDWYCADGKRRKDNGNS